MHRSPTVHPGCSRNTRAQEKSSRARGPRAVARARPRLKRVRGGFLAQERAARDAGEEWRVVTKRQPTDVEPKDLQFAWRAVGSVKSNAIVLARDGATIGIGAGQMSRV